MTEFERTEITGRPLVLYDGVCVLCNGVVRFLLHNDKRAKFRFAPLQSPLAREVLSCFGSPASTSALEGVILITDPLTPAQRLFRRSDAVAHAFQLLREARDQRRFWSIAGTLLTLFPRPLREFGYTIVARLRYRLFGRYPTCPIPTPEQRGRILGVYNQ